MANIKDASAVITYTGEKDTVFLCPHHKTLDKKFQRNCPGKSEKK